MAAFQHVELLRRIPIFRNLQDSELRRILDSPNNGIVDYQPLQTIVEENEIGDCMYVLLDGLVDVRIKAVDGREITIASLQKGDYFGEQALIAGSGKRNATVRALQPTRVFRISRQDALLGLNHKEPEAFPELGGVPGMEEMSAEQRIRQLLRGNRLFRSLPDAHFAKVAMWTELVEYAPGAIILREGDAGDDLYVVMEGTVEIFILDEQGKVVILARLGHGQYFGEQALLPGGPSIHNANARANDAVTLVKIAKEFFQQLLTKDKKLAIALKTVGEAQRKKIEEIRTREDW